MKTQNITKTVGLLAAAAMWVGMTTSANAALDIQMSTHGIGYINPAFVGANFTPAHLDTLIGQYNGTVVDVVADSYFTVVGSQVPAPNLSYPLNTDWYTPAPGGDSVNFTGGTLGANGLGLPNNTATATLDLGTGGYLYVVAQWDGGSSTGNNSAYYIGGLAGEIRLLNDLVDYIGGNASQQALSHFYLVPGTPPDDIIPVPEPATMIAGALLLLPFAASTLRTLRKKHAA